ncbi:MAG: AsmA family protein [Gammaproteobacteria bacterium]|nr:AsmA family protein [Gammaproteobacteria bacterium]
MIRLLKWGATALAVLLLLLFAVVVITPMVVDINRYKGEIIAFIEEKSGRRLEIEDDIRLSLYPRIGADLRQVRMLNPPGFGHELFAAVDKLSLKVNFFPLLQRKIEVSLVEVDGLQLNLLRREDGRSNWEDLLPASKPLPEEVEEREPSTTPPQLPIADLFIDSIEVLNSQILWEDLVTGEALEVRDVEITSGEVRLNQPIDLYLRLGADNRLPQLSADLALDVTIDYGLETGLLKLIRLVASVEAEGEAVGGEASARLAADLLTTTLGAAGAPLTTEGFSLNASLKRSDLQLSAGLSGDLTANSDQKTVEILPLQLTVNGSGDPFPGGKLPTLQLRADLSLEQDGTALTLKQIELMADSMKISGELKGQHLTSQPEVDGQFNLDVKQLRALLERLGVVLPLTADSQVLAAVEGSLDLKAVLGDAGVVAIKPLSLRLDDSTVKGEVTLNGAAVGYNLHLDQMDLDRYLPPVSEGEMEAPPTTEPPSQPQEEGDLFPVEALRKLEIDGVLTVGQLKVKGVTMDEIALMLKGRAGNLQLQQKIAAVAQGSVESTLDLDLRGEQPQIRLQQEVKQLALGDLLLALNGKRTLSGTARLESDLTASGSTISALKAGLNGDLSFRLEEGAVEGINIGQLVRQARAKYRGEAVTEEEPLQTDFSELSGTATVESGVIRNRDLSAKSPYLRISGAGAVNLVEESVDYTLQTLIEKSGEGQGGAELNDLVGVTLPVRVRGPWSAPVPSVEWNKALTAAAEARLKAKGEAVKREAQARVAAEKAKVEERLKEEEAKAKEKLQQQLEEKLKKGLGGESGDLGNALKGLFR